MLLDEDKLDELKTTDEYFLDIKFFADAVFDRPGDARSIIRYFEKNLN